MTALERGDSVPGNPLNASGVSSEPTSPVGEPVDASARDCPVFNFLCSRSSVSNPMGEPVAWRWKVSIHQLNWQFSCEKPVTYPQYCVEPLYAHPETPVHSGEIDSVQPKSQIDSSRTPESIPLSPALKDFHVFSERNYMGQLADKLQKSRILKYPSIRSGHPFVQVELSLYELTLVCEALRREA